MAAVIVLFFLASIVLGVLALIPRSPVRRWYATRQRPGRAAGLSILAWVAVLVVLVGLASATSQQDSPDDAAETATPTAPARPAQPSNTTPAETTPPTTAPPTASVAPAPAGVPDDVQQARVRRVVDGDTLEIAAVSAGPILASVAQVDVRLLEIDTPETKHPTEPRQCYGPEATARLEQLAPQGSTVWVQRDQELRDRYGRYLLYLYNDEGVFVNLRLVSEGYARPTRYEPNDRHWQRISAAGEQARSARAGLWGACPPSGTREQEPQPAPQPPPETDPGGVSYPYPPDLDCSQIEERDFPVQEGDPHGFDGNGDGIGCES